jgi:hypothetical protein
VKPSSSAAAAACVYLSMNQARETKKEKPVHPK